MDNISGTEWMVFMGMIIHMIMCPFTKVEESFNTQAIHDLLFLRHNFSQYDHLQFPGVVPRTFSGPVVVAGAMFPFYSVLSWFDAHKMWNLFLARFSLGLFVLGSFLSFCRAVQTKFGRETADFLRLITVSQFHFIFYSTRPLPNTFAIFLVLQVFRNVMDGRINAATKLATVAVLVYRFELVLLFGPLYLLLFFTKEADVLATIKTGVVAGLVGLAVTIPIDSLFWQQWIWPEGKVILFNVVENKSHLYGTTPFLWYFYSVLPRALLGSLFLIPFGLLMDRRLWRWAFVALSFIGLYSFLPHKELRFIIYAFPLLNLAAANFCARLWINKDKSWARYLIALGVGTHLLANVILSCVFLYASARNYPGGDALAHLQTVQRFHRNDFRRVHIDEFCAETGISQFLNNHPAWEYNKTENLPVESLKEFDFLLIGSQKDNVYNIFQSNYSKSHKELFSVEAFFKFTYVKSSSFPYYWPRLKFKNKVIVLKKLDL
uniref:Mannosyltransferase n=1 Tax=Bursaphelenchus xylophilus TaxID=6326 RepID=A0A1I7RST6_BURXY